MKKLIGVDYHYWVGNKTGYVMSSAKDCPRRRGERMKYMGHSKDIVWPRRMSTGRLLHEPNLKDRKKKKKNLKKLNQNL